MQGFAAVAESKSVVRRGWLSDKVSAAKDYFSDKFGAALDKLRTFAASVLAMYESECGKDSPSFPKMCTYVRPGMSIASPPPLPTSIPGELPFRATR